MVRNTLAEQIARLSTAERILLVQDLWDTVADEPEAMELSPQQARELDRRLKAYERRNRDGKATGSPWSAVKRRIQRKKK